MAGLATAVVRHRGRVCAALLNDEGETSLPPRAFLAISSISSRPCDLVDGRAQEKDKVGARAPIGSFCDDIGGLLVSEPKWRAVQWCGASGRSGTRTVVGRCSDALWVPLV